MSTVTVSRADLTTEEVVAALGNGLRADYNVLPGMAIGQLAFQGLRQGRPNMVAVGIGDSRLIKAQVTITEPVRTLGGACIDIDDGRGARDSTGNRGGRRDGVRESRGSTRIREWDHD